MSEQTHTKSPTPPVVEILSGDEEPPAASSSINSFSRHPSVIEVASDISDNEVEIVAENHDFSAADDIQITGHSNIDSPVYEIEFPGGPPSRSGSRERSREPQTRSATRPLSQEPFRRNVRRRRNPIHLYRAALFNGLPELLFSDDDIPEMMAQHQQQIIQYFSSREGEVSAAIMERISREEETSLDRKMESEKKHNRKVLEKKQGVASTELAGYTNNIAPEENLMCELCGVVLGEGIPSDFEPNPEYDENLEHHASQSKVMAPWFCIRQCFDTDKELSKRVFAARCGHVFCGRCIKNIGNRPVGKSGRNAAITILNPQVSAPRKCPAEGCGVVFNKSKKTFTELFL